MSQTIYIASKTKHAPKWIKLREQGVNIISTWIDEHAASTSSDICELAWRCIQESKEADVTILYTEANEHLRFSLAEIGSALSAGKKVIVVGNSPSLSNVMLHHPNIQHVQSISEALALVNVYVRNTYTVAYN